MTSIVSCSPNRGGSAPGSRWRSKRWHGWCRRSNRPSTATTRSSTTGSSSSASSDSGVVFVDDIYEVPPGRPIMLSAHGSAPEVVEAAQARGSFVVDSVCPLVTKVHHEVKVRAGKGYRIVYVGHEGHEEAVGTMAVAPTSISRVETVDEVDALPEFEQPVALLAQTTLVAPRLGRRRRPGARALPRRVDAGTQRPVLRHHEPPVVAAGDGRPVRRGGDHRIGELVQHACAREARPRSRLRPGAPRQRSPISSPTISPARSASPPERRLPRSSSTRCWSDSPRATASRSCRRHRGGRVLPSATQHPRPASRRSRWRAPRCSAGRC